MSYPYCKVATTLYQILLIRNLRNTSCQFMTNYQKHISVIGQIIWYFRYYSSANRSGEYRIYLFYNFNNRLIGYGALHFKNGRLYVTECVSPACRRQGYGNAILTKLIDIGQNKKQNLVAEIWTDNKISCSMHEKMGFKLMQTSMHNDKELNTYLFSTIKIDCESCSNQS